MNGRGEHGKRVVWGEMYPLKCHQSVNQSEVEHRKRVVWGKLHHPSPQQFVNHLKKENSKVN